MVVDQTMIRRGCCVGVPLALGAGLGNRRHGPAAGTASPQPPNSASALNLPRKSAGVRHRHAVGRQGDRDRQRRGHHPDRHRPAPGAAGDRQRRPDSRRRGRPAAPAGAEQPDRRDAADPGRQGRGNRDHRCRHRQDRRSGSPATSKQTPEQMADYLKARGSSIRSIRRQIQGEIAWRRLQSREDRKRGQRRRRGSPGGHRAS